MNVKTISKSNTFKISSILLVSFIIAGGLIYFENTRVIIPSDATRCYFDVRGCQDLTLNIYYINTETGFDSVLKESHTFHFPQENFETHYAYSRSGLLRLDFVNTDGTVVLTMHHVPSNQTLNIWR